MKLFIVVLPILCTVCSAAVVGSIGGAYGVGLDHILQGQYGSSKVQSINEEPRGANGGLRTIRIIHQQAGGPHNNANLGGGPTNINVVSQHEGHLGHISSNSGHSNLRAQDGHINTIKVIHQHGTNNIGPQILQQVQNEKSLTGGGVKTIRVVHQINERLSGNLGHAQQHESHSATNLGVQSAALEPIRVQDNLVRPSNPSNGEKIIRVIHQQGAHGAVNLGGSISPQGRGEQSVTGGEVKTIRVVHEASRNLGNQGHGHSAINVGHQDASHGEANLAGIIEHQLHGAGGHGSHGAAGNIDQQVHGAATAGAVKTIRVVHEVKRDHGNLASDVSLNNIEGQGNTGQLHDASINVNLPHHDGGLGSGNLANNIESSRINSQAVTSNEVKTIRVVHEIRQGHQSGLAGNIGHQSQTIAAVKPVHHQQNNDVNQNLGNPSISSNGEKIIRVIHEQGSHGAANLAGSIAHRSSSNQGTSGAFKTIRVLHTQPDGPSTFDGSNNRGVQVNSNAGEMLTQQHIAHGSTNLAGSIASQAQTNPSVTDNVVKTIRVIHTHSEGFASVGGNNNGNQVGLRVPTNIEMTHQHVTTNSGADFGSGQGLTNTGNINSAIKTIRVIHEQADAVESYAGGNGVSNANNDLEERIKSIEVVRQDISNPSVVAADFSPQIESYASGAIPSDNNVYSTGSNSYSNDNYNMYSGANADADNTNDDVNSYSDSGYSASHGSETVKGSNGGYVYKPPAAYAARL